MKFKLLLITTSILAVFSITVSAQNKKVLSKSNNPAITNNDKIARPKLMVGIVVDQMRWDYLYRFYDLYKTGGFKRLMNKGFSCDNTMVPYLPTVTACGHTCVYTGSVPAIHGITGNNWFDNNTQKSVYCTEDNNDSIKTVGSKTVDAGRMSPQNVLVTTITDELRLATNFQSKVIGLSIKDRGAIIPAGHAANAAYWYDGKSGNFISSTYYMKELPEWMQAFNKRKLSDSLYNLNWNTIMPASVYNKYCDTDENLYESKLGGRTSFPYNLAQFAGKDYAKISGTPYGNNLLFEAAKVAISAEQLGKGENTDFICISFSSTDYVGHAFGPNSWELADTYIRLDETISYLLDYLDKTVGQNQYSLFLTADHAGAHVPEYLNKHHINGGRMDDGDLKKELGGLMNTQFGNAAIINAVNEFDIYLNHSLIDTMKLNIRNVKEALTKYLLQKDYVLNVVDKVNASNATIPDKIKEMVINGYNPARSGDLQIINKTGVIDGGKTGMTHGVWNTYDSHIPLLFYGYGISIGHLNKETYMTDISATVAALLHIQMPSGCIGKVIEEVIKKP